MLVGVVKMSLRDALEGFSETYATASPNMTMPYRLACLLAVDYDPSASYMFGSFGSF